MYGTYNGQPNDAYVRNLANFVFANPTRDESGAIVLKSKFRALPLCLASLAITAAFPVVNLFVWEVISIPAFIAMWIPFLLAVVLLVVSWAKLKTVWFSPEGISVKHTFTRKKTYAYRDAALFAFPQQAASPYPGMAVPALPIIRIEIGKKQLRIPAVMPGFASVFELLRAGFSDRYGGEIGKIVSFYAQVRIDIVNRTVSAGADPFGSSPFQGFGGGNSGDGNPFEGF